MTVVAPDTASDQTAVVTAHYDAYGARDVDALLATLAEDFVCAPLNGAPWLTGREASRAMYAANVVDWPMETTVTLGETTLGAVQVRRERTVPAVPCKPDAEVLGLYTVHNGLIARLDMVRGGDAAGETAHVAVVQAQLEAYNLQDLDAHVACFADDIVVADLNGAANLHGIDAYRARYEGVFAQFPHNRAEIVARLACGNVVVDHERVWRTPDATPFEVLAIYTLRAGKIARVDFVK
jgi:hypothetical protein